MTFFTWNISIQLWKKFFFLLGVLGWLKIVIYYTQNILNDLSTKVYKYYYVNGHK